MKKTFSASILILCLAAALLFSACGSVSAYAAEKPETAVDTIMTVGTTQAFSDEPVPEEDVQTILRAGLASESAINQQPWFFVALSDKALMAELSASGSMPQMPKDGDMPQPPKDGSMTGFPKDGEMPDFPKDGEMPDFPKDGSMPQPPQGGAKPSSAKDGEKPTAPKGELTMPAGSSGAKAALGDSPLAILVFKDESSSSPNPDFDCGLAVQNMYIAAASLGYGAKIISSPTMTLNGADHDKICEKLGVDPSLSAVAVLLIGKADETVDGVSGASVRAELEEKAVLIG